MNIIVRICSKASLMLSKSPNFDRPIFLVGGAKSGTTICGALFYLHPYISGGIDFFGQYGGVKDFRYLLERDNFKLVAEKMEQKKLWDRYWPVNQVSLRIGKELVLENNTLGRIKSKALKTELKEIQCGARLFSKAPYNTFRIHALRELFSDAKIVAIHRDGRDVISSWGRAESNGVSRWEQWGGFENAIQVFARKWNETIDHIEENKNQLGIYTFKYEDLIADCSQTISSVLQHCEIPYIKGIYSRIRLEDQRGKWQERIPEKHHALVCELTAKNRERIGYS